jgi:hypothetical protein
MFWKLVNMTSKNLSTILGGVCECPVNLMLGPVIHTFLLDQMTSRNLSTSSVEYMNDQICKSLFYFWCLNATFSNFSAISWRPLLVAVQAGENHRPLASSW